MGGSNSNLSDPLMSSNTDSAQMDNSGDEVLGSSFLLQRHSWHPWFVAFSIALVTFRAHFDPFLKFVLYESSRKGADKFWKKNQTVDFVYLKKLISGSIAFLPK
jgi:hypothetical protein